MLFVQIAGHLFLSNELNAKSELFWQKKKNSACPARKITTAATTKAPLTGVQNDIGGMNVILFFPTFVFVWFVAQRKRTSVTT